MRKTTACLLAQLCLWSCAALMAAEKAFGTQTAPSEPMQLLCHLSFDDHGNNGLNALKVQGGQDAVVRVNPDKAVMGLGEVTCITDKAILAGLAEGDGAVEIPCRTHVALPIPSVLSDNPRRPYTIAMKVKFKDFDHYNCILSMPSDNRQDAMSFLERGVSPKLSLKVRGSKTTGPDGGFASGEWAQLVFQFDGDETRVLLNGREVCVQTVALAGSRADCSKAGGYFLLSADNDGEDAPMYWADVKVYDGIVTPEDCPEVPAAAPALVSAAAKASPLKIVEMPRWDSEVKQFTRDPKAPTVKTEDQPPDSTSPKAVTLPPLPAVMTAPKAPTVKPLLPDDFMNASTRKAAIAHVRESLRELLGPMSDEENAAFEKRWNAVADYPAPEILDWLKKVSPIISELVRLKAAVEAGIVACDDALREAAYAHIFGNAEAEYGLMRTYVANLTAMKTAQARMDELQLELDALGEMPDPEALRNVWSTRRRQARATVDEVVLGKKKADVSDGKEDYFVLTRVYCKENDFQAQVKDPVANLYWANQYKFVHPYAELAKQSEQSARKDSEAKAGGNSKSSPSDPCRVTQRVASATSDSDRLDGDVPPSRSAGPVGAISAFESKVSGFSAEGRLVWHVTDGGGKELDRRGASYRISWGVPTTVVHAKADTTFSFLGDVIAKAVKNAERKNGGKPASEKAVKKREPQEADGKVEIVLRVDGEVQKARLEGDLPKGDRVNVTFGLGTAGRFNLHMTHKDKGEDAKRTVDIGGSDAGRDLKLVADWGEGENGPRNLSLDLSTIFAGQSAGLVNKTVYFEYEARKMTPDEAATEANILDAKFRELAKRGSHAADVPGELAVEESFPMSEDAPDTPEAKAERIAFHQQNITFIEGTISRLQKELAGEKDPSRRAALEWQLVCERSNVISEQDRIRAEETGTFVASRTPFDAMCVVQQRENTLRQIRESERLNRLRDVVDSLRSKQSLLERDATDRIVERLLAEDPMNTEKWIQLKDALWAKEYGAAEGRAAMIDSDIADLNEQIRRIETLKNGCDLVLALGGAAGAPRAISLVYQLGTGFAEDDMKGAAKNAVCFYSDAVDIAWSACEGYREDGLTGALKGAVWSTVMNKGVPFLVGKVQGKLNADVRDLFGGNGKVSAFAKVETGASAKSKKAAAKTDAADDVKAYKAEQARAESEISEFIRAQNAFNKAKLEHMTDGELTKIKSDLTKATARVNANPTAKAILKYDAAYEKTGAAFDETLGRIHETIKTKFYADMKAKGFNDQEIVQFRNASSKGTVGMDADWGLKETPDMTIMRNGKRVSVHEWQREATESWNRIYKKSTGFDAQKSWENVTTHQHAEAYRNMEILKYSKEANNMDAILSKLSVSDAQQAFDVTRYKADEMLGGKDFPRLVYVREAVRGTAKDMKTKLIPALDVKIKALRKAEAALTKQGKALSKSDAHNLARLEAAMAHYESMMKTFDDIGTGKMPPEEWDDSIRTATGGRGVREAINDMADMFKSLVL